MKSFYEEETKTFIYPDIVKMFAKKKFVQKMKNYTFLKSP